MSEILEDILNKSVEELTDEDKAHLREHADELTDEEQEKYKEIFSEIKPTEEVTVNKNALDRKDLAVKRARERERKEKERADAAEEALKSRGQTVTPESIQEEVRKQIAETQILTEREKAVHARTENEDERKAILEYMAAAPSTGNIQDDVDIARNFVLQKNKAGDGVSAPHVPETSVTPSPVQNPNVSQKQKELAPQMGIANEDLEKFGGEIKF